MFKPFRELLIVIVQIALIISQIFTEKKPKENA